MKTPIVALIAGTLVMLAHGQAQSIPKERPRARPPSALTGWADWEGGEALLQRLKVPPAPVRSPAEELATFRVAPGYRVELVAAEPLVHNPIFFEFDPEGRIWVVEYQGYMRDLAGTGEGNPICRVVVLEDTDGDGRADKSTVFLDHLVMPRSLAFVKGGVLVQEPPTLWFCEDLDGDLRCDRKRAVGTMGVAGNPQHTANGLRHGIDNWLHCADWPKKYRWRDGKLIEAETIRRGQFGVTFDETGRFLTCYENKALHGDLIAPEYILRNPNLRSVFEHAGGDRRAFGVDVDLATNAEEVFPIRVTPAVTLGALELRDDGRLRTYTIASGVCCYDGHQFPDDAQGNVFVPESGGHLVGRLVLPPGIEPQARRFYPPEQEFLASTDERFRPVNARVGPDGALYLADLYHGIIEHAIFMVPWLEKQIRERHLEEGNDLGRIWRVVAENRPIDRTAPHLTKATSAELIETLGRPNGWHRLTAQRLLVERGKETVDALKQAAKSSNPHQALHALWAMEGLEAIDENLVTDALTHADQRVRIAAIKLFERLPLPANYRRINRRTPSEINDPDPERARLLHAKAAGASKEERLQIVLTLGALDTAVRGYISDIVAEEDSPLFRTAAASSLRGSESELIDDLHGDSDRNPGIGKLRKAPPSRRDPFEKLLAQCVIEEAVPDNVTVLAFLCREEAPGHTPLLEALAAPRLQPIALRFEPFELLTIARRPDKARAELARRALANLTWPGAPKMLGDSTTAKLTPEQAKLVQAGQQTYASICAACHQPHGGGSPGVAPPLAGSDWVKAPAERLARIVLHGLYGPVEVNGQRWNLHMPGLAALSDEQLAGALSYARTAWGNAQPVVQPEIVAAARKETAGRSLPWRAEELGFHAEAEPAQMAIEPDASGVLILPARLATCYGQKLSYRPSLDILAPWRIKEDAASWSVSIPAAGEYEVFVTLAADDASAGDQFALEAEESRTVGTVLSSGAYDRFREVPAGRLKLHPGFNRILMRAEGPLREELADVRSLRLAPVR